MGKIWLVLAALLAAGTMVRPVAAEEVPTVTADDHVLGKADAPNTIIEYASLTCPHCARFDQQVLPELKKGWIDTGKAKLIFRDFPLDAAALYAATLARCAPPDRYFNFIDVLFQSQDGWGRSTSAEAVKTALTRIGKVGGLSEEKINACLSDEKLQDAVAKSRYDANQLYGVNSTPTFFINGKKLEGEHPLADFEKMMTADTSSATH